ncbi:hypothetical protein DUI87_11390 [Hirundo rustica rustica]|uniref:Uncharacterized protein n=1 Tax=Hirundo rustica rustica TaxID=333673 RepID=A0A3M0KFC1_HIRRU|nr:hypothetical protein DUI87_11390 [Hirundo rustica rustica]
MLAGQDELLAPRDKLEMKRTITEEKRTKNKATVSVSTQAVTEEKETKSAISISTQTVTEAEQAKPVAVAPVQKKKSKSKSVRIMTDEDVAGPSHPAEETEPEIITPLYPWVNCVTCGGNSPARQTSPS